MKYLLILIPFFFACSEPKVIVENIKVNKDNSVAWAVTGMVRNNSYSNIKGVVKIKFLNSNGDIVHNNRAFVNGGDALKPRQAGNYKYFTDPDKFDDVVDFDVEFYERQIKL